MFVLDTDCFSLLDFPSGIPTQRLRARLATVPVEDVVTTIITYEEQTRGWFALLAKARTISAQVTAYLRLSKHLENYRQWTTLDFDDAAAVQFQRLRSLKLKVATMDLKIAAIVIAQAATLITRNRADFSRIPGLSIEDWSV
jgi:tRNA(fMet)-specific endonuclease VapC